MLIKNNFPGPKDSVEAKAWTMYGQQYFTANKLERRLMRLRARVQHDREARKVNLQWIEDSLKNLELYKHDLGYDDCEKAYGALQETNRYLDVQSYGLKAMMDEDVKENLCELQDILKNGEGNRIEINALLNEIKTYITVEFEKGHQELELNFEHIQKHVNKIVQAFVKAGLAKSGKEAKRLIFENGAKIDDELVTSTNLTLTSEMLARPVKLSAGKKRHALVTLISG